MWDAASPPLQGWRLFLFRVVPYAFAGFVACGLIVAIVGAMVVPLFGDEAPVGVELVAMFLVVGSSFAGAAVGIGCALAESSSEQTTYQERAEGESA